MKSSTIVLLSSFIIACNAELNYTNVAEKVVTKLLEYKDPLNGIFNHYLQEKYYDRVHEINDTKFYDWNRLELVSGSVNGSRLSRDTHDFQFEIQLPPPMIKGNLSLEYNFRTYNTEIRALSSKDIDISISGRINEFYREIAWRNVSLSVSLAKQFVSHFNCEFSDKFDCLAFQNRIDGENGAWNQPYRLVTKIKQLLFTIRYV